MQWKETLDGRGQAALLVFPSAAALNLLTRQFRS